ncbi:hypothetical protein QQZ08_010188 [Neonectria magnoliae]|uniref:Calcineurin-like phosphoesterase domain-containing protein n=1 Tax=Neonectria magnoliae TaxID=2732573 RepID=A0ABR1HJ36_9HYPO
MGLLTWLGLRRRNQWEPLTLVDHILSSPLTFLAIQFYHIVLLLRGRPFSPPRGKTPIRVVCISDTHDQTVSVPPGDVLIHAGDLSNAGTVADLDAQLNWLRSQPHPVKIVVAGNHDSWFDPISRHADDHGAPDLTGIDYLQSSMVVHEINGRKFHIFGVPDIPKIGKNDFAFQYTEATQPWLSKIPLETDILITHCPPQHHRDLGLGCPHLLREIWRVKPRLHVFGHVHWAYGKESAFFDDFQETYERLLSRPRRGLVWDFVPNETWVEILRLAYHGVHSILWKWLMSGPGSNQGSVMVNAAQMYGNSGKAVSRAVIVDM